MCDLNSASVEEIRALEGVTVPEAWDLMLWRPYLDWVEVASVPGFDPERIAKLRDAGAVLGVPPYATWVRNP